MKGLQMKKIIINKPLTTDTKKALVDTLKARGYTHIVFEENCVQATDKKGKIKKFPNKYLH